MSLFKPLHMLAIKYFKIFFAPKPKSSWGVATAPPQRKSERILILAKFCHSFGQNLKKFTLLKCSGNLKTTKIIYYKINELIMVYNHEELFI